LANVIVGVADCKVSQDPEATLITFALGSCIALVLYDPAAKVGGLLHFMLPSSSIDTAKSQENPAMYADTGVPWLIKELQKLGANPRKLVAHMAGGAQILDPQGLFAIGKRNHIAAKNLLWKAGILTRTEAVGGSTARSFGVQIATGRIWLKQQESTTTPAAAAAYSDIFSGELYGIPGARS
jgi:chemotaxis protein CheD